MKRATIGLVSLLWSCALVAQIDTTLFKAFVGKSRAAFDIPGLSMAVVKDGEVILSKGWGKRSEEKTDAPDGNTQFGIASLTKAFTSTAMAMLVEDGKVNWDDPVVKHLPNFRLYDSLVTKQITIEDILSHRSGLITFDGDLLWYGTSYSREEVVERIRYRPLTSGLREKFGYQNIMYITAGEVIEKVSGMSWDEFVSNRILQPLEMTRTTTDFQTFFSDPNHATPFIDGEEIFMMSYNNSGATAATNSTTNDLVKWLSFWLNKGKTPDGNQLISEASIEQIWTSHISLDLGNFDKENGTNFKAYGMGWFLMDYKGKKVVHHGGGLPGYISKIALVPEDNLGIVVLTNDMSSVPTMLMYAVIDWLEGDDYGPWLEKFEKFKRKGDERAAMDKKDRLATKKSDPIILPIEDYLGLYREEMYGDALVTMVDSGLVISLLPSKELFTGKMEPWDDHAFRFDHNDPFLTYGITKFDVVKDVIQGFTIDLPNQDFHFDKLAFKKVGVD